MFLGGTAVTNGESDDPVRPYAASPCLAGELDAEGRVPLCSAEIVDLLNQLVEGERAGARGLIDLDTEVKDATLRVLLNAVAKDEARFCAMLSHHVTRLGGTASRVTGVFYDKLKARATLADKLKLLDRGQSAVVRMLVDAIPRIKDMALRDDLEDMRAVHVYNIERCAKYL
jgi:hypothetical protein